MFENGVHYTLVGKGWQIRKRTYRLLSDYTFGFKGKVMTIPAGFEWNGPSGVPILKYFGQGWLEPSLVHDWLYETHFSRPSLTREEVDDHFFKGLKDNGVRWLTVWMIDEFFDPIFEHYWKTESAADSKFTIPLVLALLASIIPAVAFMALMYMGQAAIWGWFVGWLGGVVAALF